MLFIKRCPALGGNKGIFDGRSLPNIWQAALIEAATDGEVSMQDWVTWPGIAESLCNKTAKRGINYLTRMQTGLGRKSQTGIIKRELKERYGQFVLPDGYKVTHNYRVMYGRSEAVTIPRVYDDRHEATSE